MTTDRAGAPAAPAEPSGAAATTPLPGAGVALVLPDDWAVVDLTDPDERVRGVTDLVDRQVGTATELAALRASLTRVLRDQTARAAQAQGMLLAVSLMQADGLPVPASVTVHRLAGERLDERGRTVVAEVAGEDAAPGQAVDLGETPAGVVLRRVRGTHAVQDLSSLTGTAGTVESFVVDYWVEPHGVPDLVYLAFSSPLVAARDALLELFDTIARSVHAVGRPPED